MIEVAQITILAVFVLGLFYMLKQIWLCWKSNKSWLSTDGRVIEAGLEMWPSAKKEEATVGYEYEIDGKKYRSYRWSFFNIHSRSRYARTIISQYPKGRKVKVYYDPVHPSCAVIDHSFPIKELTDNLLIVMTIVIAALWILEIIKQQA